MKLLEALEILKRPVAAPGVRRQVFLACGFTPLHLETFLSAHLRTRWPGDAIEVKTGLYGDLAGNLERVQPSAGSMVCLVLEWPDLDGRLGIRSLGGWRAADVPDIVDSARRQSERVLRRIQQLAELAPICVSLPTLPLPPLFPSGRSQAHQYACQLQETLASLANSLSASPRVRLINRQRLDEVSPLSNRFDVRGELSSGFPYTLEHASRLSEMLAALIHDAPPKKGLITDLDDTLWAGILGEVGADGIAWDLASHAPLHGLYQQFLASLASAGVLLAIASKNNAELVGQALRRSDLLAPADTFFPIEANWHPKPESIARILKVWNIGAGDVVFVDDSPMEVAEVQAAFPQMECVLFPKTDPRAVWELLGHMRDIFGKSAISKEDTLRSGSIRATAVVASSLDAAGPDREDFLRQSEAFIEFSPGTDASDKRAFELVNKTNQFNLNGKRFSEGEWMAFLQDPQSFLLTVAYEDKYGPLGKIAVALGKAVPGNVTLDAWVMSCRAFSRRIEHQTLHFLFERFAAHEIVCDFRPTPRNGPLQEFIESLIGHAPTEPVRISRHVFEEKSPPLYHRVQEAVRAGR